MYKIFICYRREDSQYVTDHIHTHMVAHFGEDNVFLDVGSIPPGVDFREYLHAQVEAHDVMLVIIGPDWERIMQERANQTDDFVRIEIESALKLKKRAVPVLVKSARVPNYANLPEAIQDLQYLQAASVRRLDVKGDCARLAGSIKGITFQLKSSAQLKILAILPDLVDATRKKAEQIQRESDISIGENQFKLIIPFTGKETIYNLDMPLVVGRSDESTEKIPEIDFAEYDKKYGISRSHARFDYKDGSVFITDLGSTNGTYVGEYLLDFGRPHELCNRDIIHFGALGIQIYIASYVENYRENGLKKLRREQRSE